MQTVVPSTMNQQLVQWVDDDVEFVQPDDSLSVATWNQPSGSIKV
jgi:hypothetical protein